MAGKCATCEYMKQPEACKGCDDASDYGSWTPCEEILDYFGDDSEIYSELNWGLYGCFGDFEKTNSACDRNDCSLSVICEKRSENKRLYPELENKYGKKLWCDLNTDLERAEFILCGRAWSTGIIARAIESDLVRAFTIAHNQKRSK